MDSLDRYAEVEEDEEMGGTRKYLYVVNGQPSTYFTYIDNKMVPRYLGTVNTAVRIKYIPKASLLGGWQMIVDPTRKIFTVFRTDGMIVKESREESVVELLRPDGMAQTLQFSNDAPERIVVKKELDESWGWCTILFIVLLVLVVITAITYEAYAILGDHDIVPFW
jgi:hypothetical protein